MSSEPVIHANVEILGRKLKESLSDDRVLEMGTIYLAMTTDIISSHAFDKSLDLLANDQSAADWKKTINAVAEMNSLTRQFTWMMPFALKLPLGPLQILTPELARIIVLHRVGRISTSQPTQNLQER